MALSYFLSDLHLFDIEDPNARALIHFLTQEARAAQNLVLVGDIFDLWIAHHNYFIQKFKPIVDAVRELRGLGVEIHFFEGNHDLYLNEFWQKELGVQVHADVAYFNWDGLYIRCEHGDLMNKEDLNYIQLRKFLRSGALTWLAHHSPGWFAKELGENASRLSRRYSRKPVPGKTERIRAMMNRFAKDVAEQDSFDVVITGHTHVREDYTYTATQTPSQRRFINLGSWIDEAPHVLKFQDGKFEWLELLGP